MDFYFLTKDIDADYNIIGWIPPSADLTFLDEWREFNFQDSPELLIIRQGGKWTAYITTLPTGRKDNVHRNIQLTLIITGNVSEGGKLLGLLDYVYEYLQNGYIRNESEEIQSIIQDFIHEEEPTLWSHNPQFFGKANELGEKLISLNTKENTKVQWTPPYRWYGGDSVARASFKEACTFLLTHEGVESGVATALLGIGDPEIKRFFIHDQKWDNMALLIKDKNLAITALPDKRKKDEESKTSIDRQSEVDEKKTKGKNSKTALLSVVLLLLGGLSIITYGQHMYNLRAIAHVEKAVQDINDIKPIDPKKLEQVEKLATKHNPQAEYAMGCYYMNGPEKDLDKAKDFFEKAVKDGNKDAQAKLDELKKTVETPESK